MTERDDGRVSMVVERRAVTEAAFLAMLRALQPLQSHAAGLRSVAYGQRSSGGLREVTADERAIDAGAVTRGRGAWLRLARVEGRHRAALRWLIDRAHTGDLATLAALYAEHAAPEALRTRLALAADALAVANARAAQAQTAEAAAARVARGSRALEAIAAHLAARSARDAAGVRMDGARASAEAAATALRAWGVAALSAACEAWQESAGRAA